jgi:hypothetical protein
MNDEFKRIWKIVVVAYLRYYLALCLEGLQEPQKTLSRYNRRHGRDSN